MADMTLKGLPGVLHRRLKTRAARNRRSLNAEAIACLESVVMAEPVDVAALLVRARGLRSRVRAKATDADIRSLIEDGRL